MQIFDLTHCVHVGMAVYPGAEPPQIQDVHSILKDGFAEKKIAFFSHTGTHMDAPAHIIQGGATLDVLTADRFCGKASVIDVRLATGREIEVAMLRPLARSIAEMDFVLLRSGWSDWWGDERYFRGYPVLTREAAEWLCHFNLKGVGVDMISVDREDTSEFPIHHVLLSRDMVIIENLTNLHVLPPGPIEFWCLPLKIEKGDGAPVRAVAKHLSALP